MKAVILAGGVGSRLSEETVMKPKPLVEVGGRPILWHIMKLYANHGIEDFIVALGYKGDMIKSYFTDYAHLQSDLTVNLGDGQVTRHGAAEKENWRIELINTGLQTHTGGRLRKLKAHLGETFLATYGDGVSDVDITKVIEFHKAHGKLATLTAVRPPARFGALEFDGDSITSFTEKPQTGEGWINGGFFVLEPGVLDYIDGDEIDFSKEPLQRLAEDGQLAAYRHGDFWQCMDTLRDKEHLDEMWESGNAPWKSWKGNE
ncbi:MAG: glucose-1-phosphate cytidylyltransferase [Acidimicrobiales bacterium]